MDIEIREMMVADYDAVLILWQSSTGLVLSAADSRDSIQRFLERNPGLSYVALDGDQIVGAVLCSHDGRRGYIDQLAVCESHRRQGIGRALVSRCLYNLIQVGIRDLRLFVIDDNLEAQEFWKKLGWTERIKLITMSK